MKLAAIIVAAGRSRRMGFDKLMHPLCGKPVLQHTLDAFQHHTSITQVILVTAPERFEKLNTQPLTTQVNGGAERHLSVLNGLNALDCDIELVAVHDGARPLISKKQIDSVFAAAEAHHAATSARRITDTVKRGDQAEFANQAVSRENLWAMETPQVFKKELLIQAYQKVEKDKLLVTDEVSALEHINVPTKLIHNTTVNPKITFPEDISYTEIFCNTKQP